MPTSIFWQYSHGTEITFNQLFLVNPVFLSEYAMDFSYGLWVSACIIKLFRIVKLNPFSPIFQFSSSQFMFKTRCEQMTSRTLWRFVLGACRHLFPACFWQLSVPCCYGKLRPCTEKLFLLPFSIFMINKSITVSK